MSFITSHWAKPSLMRQFDWEAVTDDYEPGDPIGYGVTEQEAVDDLVEQVEDRDGAREDAEEADWLERTGRER
jgi:hypothetical protein